MSCDPQAFASRHPPEEHPLPSARTAAANRDPVRFETALAESVSLPNGRGTNFGDLLRHD
jgi:hypothetical protein